MNNLLLAFSRFSVSSNRQLIRNISTNSSYWFRVTNCLQAEPLKRKKRIDPAIIKAREERRRKKIEKQIRRLERNARQLKPIEEIEVPLTLIDQRQERLRPISLTSEELERRVLLEKKWAKHKHAQHLTDIQMVDRMFNAQQKALDELRIESEELYQEAIQMDCNLLPFASKGPVATPAIKDYESPDGDYNDISKKWD